MISFLSQQLEMKWKRADPFRALADSVDSALAAADSQPTKALTDEENELALSKQLEGEDLDDILESLKF